MEKQLVRCSSHVAYMCVLASVCEGLRPPALPQPFRKPCNMSSGNGKMMVEFFSAAMVLRV